MITIDAKTRALQRKLREAEAARTAAEFELRALRNVVEFWEGDLRRRRIIADVFLGFAFLAIFGAVVLWLST